jgi:hypothetical protein
VKSELHQQYISTENTESLTKLLRRQAARTGDAVGKIIHSLPSVFQFTVSRINFLLTYNLFVRHYEIKEYKSQIHNCCTIKCNLGHQGTISGKLIYSTSFGGNENVWEF